MISTRVSGSYSTSPPAFPIAGFDATVGLNCPVPCMLNAQWVYRVLADGAVVGG